MPPPTTTWKLDGHTRGKHEVLKNYMDAWLPIMTSRNGNVLFIDAFAGPGKYSNGEDGSPVIALKSLIDHNSRGSMGSKIYYLFIEKDPERSLHLRGVLEDIKPQIPANCFYKVINSTFDETLNEALNSIERQNRNLAPSFVMIDPFGVSDTPMRTIGRILQNRQSEVYISLMYREISRFLEHPYFEPHLNDLFGCEDWQAAKQIDDSVERRIFLYDLYESQLREQGAKHVLHFDLYEGNRLIYTIFFGTKNLAGCDKMKQAIWKVAPFGDFKFKSGLNDQLTFGISVIDFSILKSELTQFFGFNNWITIEDILEFMKSDETLFTSSHLKTQTLKPMEGKGQVEVRPGSRNRSGTYPAGTVLRFLREG